MNQKSEIASLRLNYNSDELLEENVNKNPLKQFEIWFKDALDAAILEPNAMTLSTVSNGKPVSRIVLLKGFDENGFTFFTNYESQKGKEMLETPFVALNFFWGSLERQVRIEGKVEKLTEKESDDYFEVRPRGSQIGAWVSDQSKVISRKDLEEKQFFFEAKFMDLDKIPRPIHWGGYRVMPNKIEFWQGRPSRLHDRIVFKKVGKNWQIERLSP